jgi:solute carrier family 35 protein E1
MAYRAVFVVGLLAVATGQEENGNFEKFLNPPRGFPASSKMKIAGKEQEELQTLPMEDNSGEETAVFATKPTKLHTGTLGVFAGALAGASMLGVRVRRGASNVLGRNVAMYDSTGAVEMQGSSTALYAEGESTAEASTSSKGGFKLDIPLLLYFFFWYLGNYYYNITNKTALKAAGGAMGFPMVISCLQLGVGSLYSLLLWAAPDARKFPAITLKDIFKLFPVAFCSAGAHAGSVFALSAGAVSFGQIVKAAEPAFAAVIGTTLYGKKISKAKWLCLIPVIGGVCLASLKELDFAVSALVAASIANVFAAFKANENAEVMATPGLNDRLGSVGNQFAITTILSFLMTLPVVWIKGESFRAFFELAKTNPVVRFNLIASGLWFYGYNELATMTIKKTSAVTASVANTAKRVIVIVGVAIVMGESLNPLKMAGCAIGIGGVFLYSIIDNLVGKK